MYEIKPEIFELSNGLRVVYLHENAQVAHLGLTVLAGSRYEISNETGLAHFLEHCIFKGTKKRKAFHVLNWLDSVGGELNAYTAKEEICVYASFSKEHLKRASALISDISLNSVFPHKEIEREKDVVLDEINSYLDAPGDRIFDDFESYLFRGHALGNNILGSKESVKSFNRKHLEAYIKKHFLVENMVLSFVGDIEKNKLISILEKDFHAYKKGGNKLETEEFKPIPKFQVYLKEANFQCHAIIGGYAPGHQHEHRRAMTLLVNILGGPALNSRLTLSIREKYGYSYNVEANYTPYMDTGFWSVYFGTDPKYFKKCLALVHKELNKLRKEKLGVLQLNRAKEQLKGHIALGMDSNSSLMLGLGKSLLMFNQIDTIEQIYHGIDQITAEQLQEVANIYFDPSNCSELLYDLQ